MAGWMIAGVAASFVVLWLLGQGGAVLAGRVRRFAKGPVRLGLANLAGPHSAARSAAPAVGLGVALLAAVVLIQSSLLNQVRQVAPRTAPSLVFTEIPGDRASAFDAEVASALGPLTPDTYLRMPMFSGRITGVVEGVATAQAVVALAARHGVEMPISEAVAAIVEHGADIKETIAGLLARPFKTETA